MASLASLARRVQKVFPVQWDSLAAKVSKAILVNLVLLGQPVPLAKLVSVAPRVDRDLKVLQAVLGSRDRQASAVRLVSLDCQELVVTWAHRALLGNRATPAQVEAKVCDLLIHTI